MSKVIASSASQYSTGTLQSPEFNPCLLVRHSQTSHLLSQRDKRVKVCLNQCLVRKRDIRAMGVYIISNYFLRLQHKRTSVITYKIVDSEELSLGNVFLFT